jgi:hypothetical protein
VNDRGESRSASGPILGFDATGSLPMAELSVSAQPAQISSRSTASPGKQGSPSRLVGASMRRDWAVALISASSPYDDFI